MRDRCRGEIGCKGGREQSFTVDHARSTCGNSEVGALATLGMIPACAPSRRRLGGPSGGRADTWGRTRTTNYLASKMG